MSEVSIDSKTFSAHVLSLHKNWINNKEQWNNVDCLSFVVGKPDEDESSQLTSAIQLYIFGYEFSETIFTFTERNIYVLTTKKKATKYYEPLVSDTKEGGVELKVITREKNDFDTQILELIAICRESFSGARVGTIMKEAEKQTGDVATQWNKLLQESKLEILDISNGISSSLAVKDEEEILKIKKSCGITGKVMKNKFKNDIEDIIDKETKKSHEKLAAEIESTIEDLSKININIAKGIVESIFSPIVQSGGEFNLKFSAESNKSNIAYDTIVCALGSKYKNYSSAMARTFFVNATKSQKKAYMAIFNAFNAGMEALTDGAACSDVYDAVKNYLAKSSSPDLVKLLKKDVGFLTGIQFKDNFLALKPTNKRKIKSGMIFCLSLSFEGIPLTDKENGNGPQFDKYGIWLSDTVIVTSTGGDNLTKCSAEWADVNYDVSAESEEGDGSEEGEDDAPKEDKKKKAKAAAPIPETAGVYSTRGRTRGANSGVTSDEKRKQEEKRKQHQVVLMNKKRDEHLRAFRNDGKDVEDEERRVKDIEAYKSTKEYGHDLKANQIAVDVEREAVLVPIGGIHVPFHISTIKNVSTTDGDKATFLRLNFYIPPTKGRDVPTAMKQAMDDNPLAMYIKTLNYKSSDPRNLMTALRLIKQMQKDVKQKLQKEEDAADLVEQEALVLLSDEKPPRLQDVSMRPSLTGRKSQGTLVAHSNGFRFKENKGAKLDILYGNIRHALFQPCENELFVIIHFHLKHPIMIGKKKSKDVQFYTEVIEASQTLDGNRKSIRDPDELDEEQRERQLRKKLNSFFKSFAQKVEKVVEGKRYAFDFDIPFKDVAFEGVADKEMVMIRPCTNCLVNLTEQPAFVASIKDIEHVHFERVTFNSRNFDMAIIWKDFKKLPHRITAISNDKLEQIYAWLDDINMTYTYGPRPIQWKSIMEVVNEDPKGFWDDKDEDGNKKSIGWNSLGVEDDAEEEGEESESASAFSDEGDESEESEDEDSDDVSLVDEDDDEMDSDASDDDGEESPGEDWDEMEKKAAKSDRKRTREDDDEDEKPKKKPKKK